MDRLIEVKVNGSYLWKDNKLAGVQHEGNVNTLRITFDEGWDGFAKKVTFWDAKGQNPVERTLTADLLEDLAESTRIYLCPIPGEPMAEAGMMTLVIDGYIKGKRARSVSTELEVQAAPFIEQADQPVDPTPSQAEQIQGQIENIIGDMQKEAIRAEAAADAAEEARQNAENLALNPPIIGANGNWWAWNSVTKSYYDTGARGEAISGVYVGEGEMPANYNVQIIPGGEAAMLIPGPQGEPGEPGADGKSIELMRIDDDILWRQEDGGWKQLFSLYEIPGAGGDMVASTYDPNNAVQNAGGIPTYVSNQVTTQVTQQVNNAVGNINSILDEINGEVV